MRVVVVGGGVSGLGSALTLARYAERAYLMLHKPAGTECSQKPSAWPSIYTLLPAPLRQRPTPGKVQGV